MTGRCRRWTGSADHGRGEGRADAGYLGRVLDSAGAPAGICFQVEPGLLVTAWHVLVEIGADEVGAMVGVDGLPAAGAPAVPAGGAGGGSGHGPGGGRRGGAPAGGGGGGWGGGGGPGGDPPRGGGRAL